MLGKLLKYEFKATARMYFPLYLAVLLLAAYGPPPFGRLEDSTAVKAKTSGPGARP